MGRKADPNRSTELRKSIIDAAFVAFSQHGNEFTLKHIADILDRSTSSLYEVFENKESIQSAMTEHLSAVVASTLKSEMPNFLNLEIDESIKLLLSTLRNLLMANDKLYLRFMRSQSRRTLEVKMRQVETTLTSVFMAQAAKHPELLKVKNLYLHIFVMFNISLFSFMGMISQSDRKIDFEELVDVVGQIASNHYRSLIEQNQSQD